MDIHQKFIDHLFSCGYEVQSGFYKRPAAKGETFWRRLRPLVPQMQTVVYFHGTGNDHLYGMYSIFKKLLKNGYNIFTVDLDGHGQHSKTILDPGELHSACADAIDFCKSNFKIQNVHLMGNSLGGMLASIEATNRSDIVSLVLLAVPLHIEVNHQTIIREAMSLRYPDFWAQARLWGSAIIPALGPFNRKRFPIRLGARPGSNHQFSYIEVVQEATQDLDLPGNLARLNIPYLNLIGEDDPIARKDDWQKLNYETMELSLIPACNHFVLPLHAETLTRLDQWFRKF